MHLHTNHSDGGEVILSRGRGEGRMNDYRESSLSQRPTTNISQTSNEYDANIFAVYLRHVAKYAKCPILYLLLISQSPKF